MRSDVSQLLWVLPAKLKTRVHGMVDGLAEQIVESITVGRPDSLINDSEDLVRQAGHEFLRAAS